MYSFDPSKMVAFDLETTTNDPLKAHVVTSSVIRIDGSDADETYLLADPGIPISEEAEKVHGISNEYAKANGEPHDDVVAKTVEQTMSMCDMKTVVTVEEVVKPLRREAMGVILL